MKFKNIVTGNILTVTDETAVALMKDSERYEPVKAEAKKTGDKKPAPPAE